MPPSGRSGPSTDNPRTRAVACQVSSNATAPRASRMGGGGIRCGARRNDATPNRRHPSGETISAQTVQCKETIRLEISSEGSMNGICSLCCCAIEGGDLPFCETCHTHLMGLPYDQRMKICLRVVETENSRKLGEATSNLSNQLRELIQLSQRWSPSNFVPPPPSLS